MFLLQQKVLMGVLYTGSKGSGSQASTSTTLNEVPVNCSPHKVFNILSLIEGRIKVSIYQNCQD